jgi:hypothetical protein
MEIGSVCLKDFLGIRLERIHFEFSDGFGWNIFTDNFSQQETH